MPEKPYWHELPELHIAYLEAMGATWGYVLERYEQPAWCDHHKALNGVLGCWSLIDRRDDPPLRRKISHEYCCRCDEYRYRRCIT